MNGRRTQSLFFAGMLALVVAFFALLFYGPVEIPFAQVASVLWGSGAESPYVGTIVLETRLPMAIAALCCGSMLSVAGLMMQTTFHNPLAGPSVLGVSSGASLGVAILMLGAGGYLFSAWQPFLSTAAALVGGLGAILVLYLFSGAIRSGVALLVVGIMISYLCSSCIALLNYFAPADEIRSYLVWGLGSFSGLRLRSAIWLAVMSLIILCPTIIFTKPLNAMLMGERYLESVGFSARSTRGWILLFTGLLVAVPTAFCGPIGFIGLIVPHLCRLLFRSSNHAVLIPATIIFGALLSELCALIGIIPASGFGILPVNIITPLIGVPVILYLLIRRNRIPYFS